MPGKCAGTALFSSLWGCIQQSGKAAYVLLWENDPHHCMMRTAPLLFDERLGISKIHIIISCYPNLHFLSIDNESLDSENTKLLKSFGYCILDSK